MLGLLRRKLQSQKNADKNWYLDLLDGEKQVVYENEHLEDVLHMLKVCYVRKYLRRIGKMKEEREEIRSRKDYSAEDYRALIEKNAEIASETKKLNAFQCFFAEPYFARMDVVDDKEGYNSYYIGRKGDVNLAIVDWRAPLAVRYYQKSRVNFSINEYDYRTVLRRALSVKNGKVLDFKNEYLSVSDVLSKEEIAGRDEEILFDPYLRSILKSRKDDFSVHDIIRTIQEQQFNIVTRPERESFVLQGCAGSGKTMILLHRLSYLMYNNEALHPHDVLVITPSDSFNDFIDELSATLELGHVKTVTMQTYYFRVLENEGIDLFSKLRNESAEEPKEYLAYLYSEAFARDIRKKIQKLFRDIYGLFTAAECREVAHGILQNCNTLKEGYTKIKNASVRIRRAVLGEMREREDGGLAFTKPFRALMSSFAEAEDFLSFALSEKECTPDKFFCGFSAFYKCARLVASTADKIFSHAGEDLKSLAETVQKEINDLKSYRLKYAEREIYTYPERIEKRQLLLEEIERISSVIEDMGSRTALFQEFFTVIRLTRACETLGRCAGKTDVARWLYRETVKGYKKKFGFRGLCASDAYAVTALLAAAGRKLTPRYALVFIDEGQDVSPSEYALLKYINSDASFNVFGDLRQNITPWRGVGSWDAVEPIRYNLDRNYRNTNEIVDFVTEKLNVRMTPVGLHGKEVRTLKRKELGAFFKEKQGLKAVITSENRLALYQKRGYSVLREKGKISKTSVNVLSVYESKGLEFSVVAVDEEGMTENEKYIACTRALAELGILSD